MEENGRRLAELERRVAKLELHVEHLLDPEEGIWPTMRENASKLQRWAIALLTATVFTLIATLANLAIGR